MNLLLRKPLWMFSRSLCKRVVYRAIIGECNSLQCSKNTSTHLICPTTLYQYYSTSAHTTTDDPDGRSTPHSSVDQEEVDKFGRIAESWWDRSGEFRALHNMNELRVPLIRDALQNTTSKKTKPLTGVTILDVGCGGGILSEPLARLGANVTGVDASPENITMANWHLEMDSRISQHVQYRRSTVEDLVGDSIQYDGVVASEILEHVAHPENFVSACCNLVKPGGSLFLTTLNKTWLSKYIGVFAAERIFRIVPDGAHDWNKFISPTTLSSWLSHNGMQTVLLHGMTMNPVSQRWCWIQNTSINYAIHAVKHPTGTTHT